MLVQRKLAEQTAEHTKREGELGSELAQVGERAESVTQALATAHTKHKVPLPCQDRFHGPRMDQHGAVFFSRNVRGLSNWFSWRCTRS